MAKISVVEELRKVVKNLNIPTLKEYPDRKYAWDIVKYYKHPDSNIIKVSIKFVGLYLTEDSKKEIIEQMQEKNCKFEFFKETFPSNPYFEIYYDNHGTQICFSTTKDGSNLVPTLQEQEYDLGTKKIHFTLEEVSNHFKDAKEVKCLNSKKGVSVDFPKEKIQLFHRDY